MHGARNSPFVVGVLGDRVAAPSDMDPLRAAAKSLIDELAGHLPDTEIRFLMASTTGAALCVEAAAQDAKLCVERLSAPPGTGDPDQTDYVLRRSSLLLTLWKTGDSAPPRQIADLVLQYLETRVDQNQGDSGVVTLEGDAPHYRHAYWCPESPEVVAAAEAQPAFLLDSAISMRREHRMPPELALKLLALNNYNREFDELSLRGALGPMDSLMTSLPAEVAAADGSRLGEIDAQYGKADALAVHFQLRSDRLFQLFGLLTFALGFIYLVYEKFAHRSLLLFVYLTVLLSSLLIYYVLQDKQWFAKHLIYRALAETMRAKFYLRLARLDRRVDAARVLAQSGISRFDGFSLINDVLAGIAIPPHPMANAGLLDAATIRCIEQRWIDAQYRYFAANVGKLEISGRRVRFLKQSVFVVIVLVVMALFFAADSMENFYLGFGVSLANVLTFCMGFLVLLLGVWQLHENKMASRELLWQYRNQRDHFHHAHLQLTRPINAGWRNEILVELGTDSLMESYLWTIHRYHREHEPPSRG
jgi:hypothetical protein